MQKIIEIAPNELDMVKVKIEKANKKAVALGVAPMVIESTTPFVVRDKDSQDEWVYYQNLRMVLNYEPLKLGDYTFVATLDHSVGKNPIINTVPDQVVPDEYLGAASRCDHCSTARFRKETFLFKDANGYKLVGRSCLKDFFGVDPTKRIDCFYSFARFYDEDSYGVSRGERVAPVDFAVAVGMAVAKRDGYTGSKQVQAYHEKTNGQAEIQTTGQKVREILFVPLYRPTREEVDARQKVLDDASAMLGQAQELVKWGVGHFSGETGSYANNMRNLLSEEVISPRYVGYVVSVIAAYNRVLEQEVGRTGVKKSNEYVGAVGERAVFEVTVLKHMTFDTDFGTTHLFTMADALGNNLVWFASGNNLDVGDTIKLKGTVKAHNERNGFKQTVLTRCKVQ